MKVKEIDERELSKINVSSDGDISKSVGLPSFESKISNNTKIDSGYYKIDENIFMSIWKFKNIYGGFNSNSENYNDALEMIRKGFISEKIIVHTHSPTFPIVNGYLRDELKIFYSRIQNKVTSKKGQEFKKTKYPKISEKNGILENWTFLGVIQLLIVLNVVGMFILYFMGVEIEDSYSKPSVMVLLFGSIIIQIIQYFLKRY